MHKTILYLVSEDWYFLSHRLSLALEAKKNGYFVHVACKDTGKLNEIKNYGFVCHKLMSNKRSTSLKNIIKEIINIRYIVKSINPSIFHLIAFRSILLGLFCVAFNKKINIIATITGLGSVFLSKNIKIQFLKFIITFFLMMSLKKNNIKLIVQNKDDYNFCLNTLKCNFKKVFLIRGSGVDINHFSFQPEPPHPPIVIAFVGRLIKDKGIEVLLDAFEYASKNNNIRLYLAGSIDHLNPSAITEDYLKNKLIQNKNIIWLGEVKDIKSLWKKSHIAVLPSRREGLPMSLLEAAASGKAIIATDVPGCREIAINNINAITVPLDNTIKLTEAIIYLSKNNEIRKRFGLKSREIVEKDMSENFIINKTISIYKNLYIKA